MHCVEVNGMGWVQLEFLTPLRMRTEGRYNSAPTFAEITQALLRRIHLLRELYGYGEGSTAWTHPLLACADRAVAEQAKFSVFHWDRMSGRQHRRINMDGVLGSITASGDLTALAPWFELGTWLQVGSGTSMGMGKYNLKLEP
jgi:CRISPR/Cas system endoribonuclease Cas6 (RAMP superfamily)